MQKTLNSKKENIFPYLLILTGFFLLLEIAFFIQCTNVYFDDFNFVANQLHIPAVAWPAAILFIGIQLTIHFLYCVIVWYATLAVTHWLRVSTNKQLEWGIGIWFLGIATILVANQHFYPNSKFSELVGVVLFTSLITKIVLFILLVLIAAVLSVVIASAVKQFKFIALLMMVASSATWFFYLGSTERGLTAATAQRPNIIIIGIDSLRPDFLSFFGHENTNTPFIDKLLANATVFNEAVTPLARTFPSWTSILTGLYPRQVNIRSNLAEQSKANLNQSLPAILQKHGYRTIYATDETRFSNISAAFGFDDIVTPPIGLNDFLIGTFNDFPMSNLLINTRLGKKLFPYSYANRPVYFTYDPNSFLKLMQPVLQAHYKQPVMLAVHFCLPHSPYTWANLSASKLTALERYEKSIDRVDQQLQDFFVLLKENHFLDHAVVVLLSDHGEALELNGDRITEKNLYVGNQNKMPKFYPPSLDNEDWNQSAGHGTDVLGLTQYHTLLAFRLYGTSTQVTGVIPGVVSLTEIKPTILRLIGLDNISGQQRSLAKIIAGRPFMTLNPEHIFLESDYSPESIRTVYPETKKVVLEGVHLFQIDPESTRLTVKPSMEQMIIQSKQYADIYGDWMLALYPQNERAQMPILVNLKTGEWTNELHSNFAKRSPALKMLAALKNFYGPEIKV